MAKYLSERENRADEVAGKKPLTGIIYYNKFCLICGHKTVRLKQSDGGFALLPKSNRYINYTAALPNKRLSWC